VSELVRGLPPLLASHLELVLIALIAAVVISMPLAILVADRPRLAVPVVAVAGVIQTIPGLALLALMVAVLAGTDGLGLGLAPFGFPPAVIALTLYAVLPILRNSITGLRGVDPSVVEAARGMGMTKRQVLRIVQLPLAAPVIAAGLRTATVWTVGAATLATPVGQVCLGNYIFAGLQTRNWNMLIAGVIAAAGLAIVLDLILGAIEHRLAEREHVWPPLVALAVLVGFGIAVLPRLGGQTVAAPVATQRVERSAVKSVKLGAKTFTEQYVLVEVMKQRLATVGIGVEVAESLGSVVAFDALAHGQIDAYVDYSGTLWITQMKRAAGVPRWRVLTEVEAWLAHDYNIRSLGSLGFENAYAIAVKRSTADKLHLKTIGDLAPVSGSLAMGGDYEWFSRGEWASVRSAYGLAFARTATFDPALLYDALTRGEVDAISAFSSDGRIAANELVTLEDPVAALPPYDAMILLAPRVANDPNVACALRPLRGKITVELMRRANLMVDRDRDKQTPAAAAAWLLAEMKLPESCN
jgi:osmoprotectant transport system permease protein